jgi:membrane-bound lytic murein transglycosylase MltF
LSTSLARAQDSTARGTLAKATDVFERAATARAAKKVSERYDPAFRKYTKRYFGPAFDWRYFKAQGLRREWAQAKRDELGRRSRRGCSSCRRRYQEITSRRPEFGPIDQPEWNIAAGIMHDRYLWSLWLNTVPDDERHRFMFASYNAGEGTINRAFRRGQIEGQPARVVEHRADRAHRPTLALSGDARLRAADRFDVRTARGRSVSTAP